MLEYGAKQYVKIAAEIGRGLSMDKFVFVENELMHEFMPAKIIEDLKGHQQQHEQYRGEMQP